MSHPVIRVEKLGKRYRIGKSMKTNGRKTVVDSIAAPFAYLASTLRPPSEDEILWALKDVSFSVEQGEAVGIVGHNGAGKSTLLKILSRITEPTEGRARITGRIGSLLEVGTGFHPELTGRENIYLNGAIMGMKKTEIDRKFDEIVEFAEIPKFIDTPVKRYSSGMYVRLAFSVAAHLEPEILLVDEVLAVGDSAFQKKCLGKMGDVAKAGRTILFVSHNMIAMQTLCSRAIWVDHGQKLQDGSSQEVISNYLQTSLSIMNEQVWDDMDAAPGNESVRIHRMSIRPQEGAVLDPITMHTPLVAEVEYWSLVPDNQLHITFHFYTEQQVIAFSTASCYSDNGWTGRPRPVGLYKSVCKIPKDFLNSGIHRVLLLVVQNFDKVIYRHEDIISFDVLDLDRRLGSWYGKEPGAVQPKLDWETEYLGA